MKIHIHVCIIHTSCDIINDYCNCNIISIINLIIARLLIIKIMLKGEFAFFIREMDVLPLEESNLMGHEIIVEVKFFIRAFFGRAQRH